MEQDRAGRVRAALTAAFAPTRLVVADESARHAGHAGNPGGGSGTHLRVEMTSAAFAGQTRVARARSVHEALAVEFQDGLHALALHLAAPGEGV